MTKYGELLLKLQIQQTELLAAQLTLLIHRTSKSEHKTKAIESLNNSLQTITDANKYIESDND